MQLGDGSPRAQVDEAGKGVQLALDVGAAGAEDDASGAGKPRAW